MNNHNNFNILFSFYNYRQSEREYKRRYSPPPIYEDSRHRQHTYAPKDYKYRDYKSNREKNYYYDAYGYKHYHNQVGRSYANHYRNRNYHGNDWNGIIPKDDELSKEQRRKEAAAALEKKRRKEYLKNICCLFPCFCCCYCRCQKFPREEDVSENSDTDVA